MNGWWLWIANQLILVVLQVLTAALLVLVHLAGRRLSRFLLLHTNRAQRDLLNCLGHEAFSFAETVYKESDGPAKLEQALSYLANRLRQHGLSVSAEEMRAAIEQAWLRNRQGSADGSVPAGGPASKCE